MSPLSRALATIKTQHCAPPAWGPAERFHRIAIVTGAGAWSLFIMGRRVNDWGFLVDGHKVPWQQYLAERGPQP